MARLPGTVGSDQLVQYPALVTWEPDTFSLGVRRASVSKVLGLGRVLINGPVERSRDIGDEIDVDVHWRDWILGFSRFLLYWDGFRSSRGCALDGQTHG